jgi:hypothetical protein
MDRSHVSLGQHRRALVRVPSITGRDEWLGLSASAPRLAALLLLTVGTAPRTTQHTKQSAAQHQPEVTDPSTNAHALDSTSKCRQAQSTALGAACLSNPTHHGRWTTTTRTAAHTSDLRTPSATTPQVVAKHTDDPVDNPTPDPVDNPGGCTKGPHPARPPVRWLGSFPESKPF